MPFINRFPGYCAECGTYVPLGRGVYVETTIRAYCADHAPDDLYTVLSEQSNRGPALGCSGNGNPRARVMAPRRSRRSALPESRF